MDGLVSRSGNMLSTFEFWLELAWPERQNIAGWCQQTFCFQFNLKLIQSKTWLSAALLNGRKNLNFFTLLDLDISQTLSHQILGTLFQKSTKFLLTFCKYSFEILIIFWQDSYEKFWWQFTKSMPRICWDCGQDCYSRVHPPEKNLNLQFQLFGSYLSLILGLTEILKTILSGWMRMWQKLGTFLWNKVVQKLKLSISTNFKNYSFKPSQLWAKIILIL